MPKIYYRCSECHSKVDMKILYDYNDKGCLRCNKCNCIIRIYPCQHNYWWELLYITIRDIVRRILK